MTDKVISIGLFISSAMSFILAASLHSTSALRKTKKNVNTEYALTLLELFKVVKTAPRHEINDIFNERRNYFVSVCDMNAISKSTKFIHVAGSKGKGSTVEYLAAALRDAGYKVGVFTSPHLHTARERIKIGKELISIDDFVRLGKKSIEHMSTKPWAVFFDLLLTTALQYFGEKGVDYIVLEAGIGGRYDSTNFIPSPVASVITKISLDHQAMLGNSIEEIAYQKAGIIKPDSHIFTSESQPESVLAIFRDCCKEVNATLHVVPEARCTIHTYIISFTES